MFFFFLRWRESSTSSKECHCRGEMFHLLSFGVDASPRFPLTKFGTLANSVFVKELWRGDTKLNLSITQFYGLDLTSPSEFKSGDGCSCDLKLLYRRGWWYNHSSKDRFSNLSISIILGFASPKKIPQDVQVATGPLHQAVELLVPALLIGVLYSVFSFTWCCALIPFCRKTVISYTEKNPVEMTEVRMERCFVMPALAMVEVLHTLNGPPGYFSQWIPMVIPNLLEVYSRGQEWALYQAELLVRFLMCKRKQVKVRTSTLKKIRNHHLLDVESFQ